MATSPDDTNYAVWCEYTTPQGDFKICRKGTYASVEEAQVGLKFSLKGGHYAHMIFEGKDITPSLKGTLRSCNDVKYYDAVDDDPVRLYIWTKDLQGNTERLSIGTHESRGCRLHTLASAQAAPRVQVEECHTSDASDKVSDASAISSSTNSGSSTPDSVNTPLTSPPSSPDAGSDKFASFSLDKAFLAARLLQICQEAVDGKTLTTTTELSTDINSVNRAASSVQETTSSAKVSKLEGKSTHHHDETASIDLGENEYDAGSEDERDESVVQTESDYDSASLRGIKDGRRGFKVIRKMRIQARRRLLIVLRRIYKSEV